MENKIEVNTYVLPEFWACPLINADYSGLSDEDELALEQWLAANQPGYCVGVEDDATFVRYHDAKPWVLPCDCATFTFHKNTQEEKECGEIRSKILKRS